MFPTGFQRPLHARLEADDVAAIVLELVLLAEDLRLGRVHLRNVGFKARQQRIADRPLLRAGGKQIDDRLQLPLVIKQQMAARKLNGIARHLRRDKGIPVAIAADPGAEVEHLGQGKRFNIEAVRSVKRCGDFAVKAGQCFKD